MKQQMAFCPDEYVVLHMGTTPALPNHLMYEERDSYLTPTMQERDLAVMMVKFHETSP